MQYLNDLMSKDVKVIDPDMTIGEAARTMRDCDFGMMPDAMPSGVRAVTNRFCSSGCRQ